MDREHIAIVGGGIAGLTLAARLGRAGIPCRVFEQAPAFAVSGAGVQLAPNAVRLLYRLDLAQRLAAVAVRPVAIEMRRWDDGRLLASTELGAGCEARYGAPYLTVHRADLHEALRDAVPAGSVRLDARCVEVAGGASAARLRFTDGTGVEAGLVVGADGIHSVARAALSPDRPRFSGQTIYRGLIPAGSVRLPAQPAVRLWLGPEQHVVCYPVAAGRLVSFGATVPAGDWRLESWTARGDLAELAAAYRGWHPEVRRLIDALDPERLHRWALHDRDDAGCWYGSRIVLTGDAAHPMLPFLAQGANQSIEDSAVLAGCLATGTGAAALARYERLRRPRASEVQRLSRRNSTRLHIPDGDGQRERDEALAGSQGLAEQRWLYGYDADAEVAAGQGAA